MGKIIIAVLFSFIVISAVFYQSAVEQGKVCFEVFCFDVELALTAGEQAKGLMFRKKLGENNGMLFIFKEEGRYSFWMKNTLIPLDIIWLNKDKLVVYISKNTRPCGQGVCPSTNPLDNARYVLELNAGQVDRIGLKVGDKLNFRLRF